MPPRKFCMYFIFTDIETLLVTFLVCGKKCPRYKSLAAKFTLEWSLPSVVSHMHNKGGTLRECLPTLVANMGFLPCMWTLMNPQVIGWVECFTTYITHKRLLACMETAMSPQRDTTCHWLATHVTYISGLVCMWPQVAYKLVLVLVTLPASLTLKALVVSVRIMYLQVNIQVLFQWEPFPTEFTWVFLSRVHCQVPLQLCVTVKAFHTNVTMKFKVANMPLLVNF
jgi:hypothetical protein